MRITTDELRKSKKKSNITPPRSCLSKAFPACFLANEAEERIPCGMGAAEGRCAGIYTQERGNRAGNQSNSPRPCHLHCPCFQLCPREHPKSKIWVCVGKHPQTLQLALVQQSFIFSVFPRIRVSPTEQYERNQSDSMPTRGFQHSQREE